MATPQDLTTTVSGRRCTRTQVRTAASSTSTSTSTSEDAIVTPTEFTSTSTTISESQQIQTSAAAAPPPPPPPSSAQDAPQASSTQAASSATGTSSAVVSSVAQVSALADLAPSSPVAAAPGLAPDVNESPAVVSAAAVATTAPSTSPVPTPSDTIPAAVTSISSILALPSLAPSQPSSVAALPGQSSQPVSPSDSPPDTQPDQPQSTETGIPSGGSAGIIAPGQGGSSEGNGLTLSNDGQTNVGGIVGGVVGGFVGLALVSTLLFLCLRRRKTGTFERWQQRISEKSQGDGGLLAKLKAVPEKLEAIPAAVGMFFAKLKGTKAGPATNPYRRHSVRSSVSSVYSVRSNGRSRSISEPPSRLRQQLRGFGDRMPSLKRSRTLLQKKQDSLVGNKSPFPGIVEDPVRRVSNAADDPFKDPEEKPETLQVLNPDTESKPQKSVWDGLQDQQRPPITPKPTASSERGSKDPFSSLLLEIEERNGSGTPEWLKDTAEKHKRTTSAQTALRSNPPSTYTASVYTNADNPFFDPSDAPPVPSQPLPPNPPTRPANAYAPLPSFNTTSSTISRDSNSSFVFFGEPGPSRPTTNMFSSKVRQSDPFDLDRPEVLGFGNVNGRTVRGSVTRQNSKSNRTSTVPNWISVDDGPYERTGGLPRKPSVKR